MEFPASNCICAAEQPLCSFFRGEQVAPLFNDSECLGTPTLVGQHAGPSLAAVAFSSLVGACSQATPRPPSRPRPFGNFFTLSLFSPTRSSRPIPTHPSLQRPSANVASSQIGCASDRPQKDGRASCNRASKDGAYVCTPFLFRARATARDALVCPFYSLANHSTGGTSHNSSLLSI